MSLYPYHPNLFVAYVIAAAAVAHVAYEHDDDNYHHPPEAIVTVLSCCIDGVDNGQQAGVEQTGVEQRPPDLPVDQGGLSRNNLKARTKLAKNWT